MTTSRADIHEQSRLRVLRRATLAVLACVCLVATSHATTVRPLTFEQLVAAADVIVRGRVVDVSAFERPGTASLATRVTLEAERVLKGTDRAQVVIELGGGTVGDRQMVVEGAPTFHVGERAVLFVQNRRTINPIVGFWQGRFPINRTPAGERVTMADGRAFAGVADIGRPPRVVSATPVVTMALADFESEVVRVTARVAR